MVPQWLAEFEAFAGLHQVALLFSTVSSSNSGTVGDSHSSSLTAQQPAGEL
jgi:hypothetical protein